MDDPRWLRLVTVGLVLAALAVGYFLLTGRLASNSATKIGSQASPVSSASASISPKPPASISPKPSPTPTSAYSRVVSRSTQTLPNTGFPLGASVIFSISIIVSGLGLRKFPK